MVVERYNGSLEIIRHLDLIKDYVALYALVWRLAFHAITQGLAFAQPFELVVIELHNDSLVVACAIIRFATSADNKVKYSSCKLKKVFRQL